jgi:hypothetical protein
MDNSKKPKYSKAYIKENNNQRKSQLVDHGNREKKNKKFVTYTMDNMISNIPGSWDNKDFKNNIDIENNLKFKSFNETIDDKFEFIYDNETDNIKKEVNNINIDISNRFRNSESSRLNNFIFNKKLEEHINNRFDLLLSNPQKDNSSLQLRDDYLLKENYLLKEEKKTEENNNKLNKYQFKY